MRESRATLLAEIGAGHDLTFVRGLGNRGDELIWAGTRRLLEEHVFREIGVDELASHEGEVALLAGSGAWCRPYSEFMPRALAIAELRFDRVIVLPSSFDVGEDRVREALARTNATVFAREPRSLQAIAGLCRARAAHDCAFFFDFSRYRTEGTGTLNAFRTDLEATEGELLMADNDDISVTCTSLEAWLQAIARHALVRTDRAHVMIAGALMGKEVEFAPSSYPKLEPMAAASLSAFPVREIAAPRDPRGSGSANGRATRRVYERLRAALTPPPALAAEGPARVTAAILSRERPELVAAAVRSVTAATVPVAVLVIDNNSGPPTRRALTALAGEDSRVELRLADRNLGCAGGRRLAVELAKTEFVLFLDDDAELMPGALEHLLADLDAHPDAEGVTALVVGGDGRVLHYGGWIAVSEETAGFVLDGEGVPFEDPSLAPSGPSGWIPGTAALLRTRTLREFPLDPGMAAYYEDNDWCYRVEQSRPGSFRRCREALVLHHRHVPMLSPLAACSDKVEKLLAQAHFLHAHGRLLDSGLRLLVPELRCADGTIDTEVARLLLELIAARGTDWATMAWLGGDLDPLLGRVRLRAELEHAEELARAHEADLVSHAATLARTRATAAALEHHHQTLLLITAGGWWRLRSRLLPVLRLASGARRLASAARPLAAGARRLALAARRGTSPRP
ncbi:MAG TPA: glycosyltransferase [Solirubrobacteraceae bacterium]|nr:glycosyltransferase [Solirubrobacteraceae bacterium]